MSLTSPRRFGKKASLVLWAVLGLVALAALGWLVLGNMDFDDPVVSLKTPVTVVGAKTALTLEAGDETTGLREVKVTFSQGGQGRVVLEKKFPPEGGHQTHAVPSGAWAA
ncbi:MAG TPA: hypothetical protein VIN67_04430, partial [Desulfobaccales bacterium]